MVEIDMSPLRDRRPLAVQVYDRLFDVLIRPEHEGKEIPTELNLVEKIGVSRTTVRQALALLEEDGLLFRGAGRRRLVASKPPTLLKNPPLEEMISSPEKLQVRSLTRGMLPATRWTSGLLKIIPGTATLMWNSVIFRENTAIASALEAVTPEIAQAVAESDDSTLLAALGQSFRSRAKQISCRISAHTAPVRAEFDDVPRADNGTIVITQVLALQGRPVYLGKHVVQLHEVSLTLIGSTSDITDNAEK